MRMRINAGQIDSNDLSQVKTEAGSSALNSLMSMIVEFYNLNNSSKDLNGKLSTIKSNIVELMRSIDVEKIEHKGVKCSLTERVNKSIDEEGLLDHCKSLNIDGLVKTIEVVDMDVLENLIYTKQIDGESIEKFIVKNISTFPKVSGKLREDI